MAEPGRKVLHVVVGHSLPTYFLNAVRSVRLLAPQDDLLVVDNASPEPELISGLRRLAQSDPQIHLLLRQTNDLVGNAKVGGLYQAYAEAFDFAFAGGYDLLHLMQADMQLLWWGESIVSKAIELFRAHPECVNIHTIALSRDKLLNDDLTGVAPGEDMSLAGYGLTDTGLYDLARWRALDMTFLASEREHAAHYREAGLTVLCHPWPSEAQIPWPAVIRRGRTVGVEVQGGRELILMPLEPAAVAAMQQPDRRTWLEDICVPWGWTCLTPMWTTGVESIDYWVLRYRAVRRYGLGRGLPHMERRGAGGAGRLASWRLPHSPSFRDLLLRVPYDELRSRLGRR